MRNGCNAHPLPQERHVFFRQWSDIWLHICQECVGCDLVGRLSITEILVGRSSSNLVSQIFGGKCCDTIDFLSFIISHATSDFADVIDNRIWSQRIGKEALLWHG